MTPIPLRRWLTVSLAVAMFLTSSPAPVAAAAPPDPVEALKSQFAAGRGIRVAERVDGTEVKFRGTVGFGPKGAVAVDVSGRNYTVAGRRVVIVRGVIYAQPDGRRGARKRWTRTSGADPVSPEVVFAQRAIVFDPVALQGLLSTTTSRRPGGLVDGAPTTVYRGVLTYAVGTPAPVSRDGVRYGESGVRMHWKLWLDGRGLARRLVSTVYPRPGEPASAKRVVRTRFSDWGARVTISAPPKSQVDDWHVP
ncbi:hypothetical protein HII36_39810 [Nonomuraea sp. NN258]|uniref:hypothetical protein n=1 Tax=Nonomuraea antri TaxID=2730852 RepID=UPI001568F6FB|nr:hypothetical protein [Nonomuraea antri]NRQ37934.1 hypothetical protein [Nonomuraea antri]